MDALGLAVCMCLSQSNLFRQGQVARKFIAIVAEVTEFCAHFYLCKLSDFHIRYESCLSHRILSKPLPLAQNFAYTSATFSVTSGAIVI